MSFNKPAELIMIVVVAEAYCKCNYKRAVKKGRRMEKQVIFIVYSYVVATFIVNT